MLEKCKQIYLDNFRCVYNEITCFDHLIFKPNKIGFRDMLGIEYCDVAPILKLSRAMREVCYAATSAL